MLSRLQQQFLHLIKLLSRHWMVSISLATAIFCATEMIFYGINGWLDSLMLAWGTAQIITTLIMSRWHKTGAWSTGIIWSAGMLSPQPVLNSGLLATLCALAILSYYYITQGILLCIINTITLTIYISTSKTLPWSTLFNFLSLYISAILLGLVIHWHTEIIENRIHRQQEQENNYIAAKIHNEIANGITTAILQLQTQTQTTTTITNELESTLKKVHNVIHLLENTQTSISNSEISTPTLDIVSIQIETICKKQEMMLHSLGIKGITILQTNNVTMDRERASILYQLLQEIYTNIGKYAEHDHGYVISILHNMKSVRITVNNAIKKDIGNLSGKFGLRQLQYAIAELGGSLKYGIKDNSNEWHLAATIPCC